MSKSENRMEAKGSQNVSVGEARGYEESSALHEGRLKILKTYKIYVDGKFPRTESGRYLAFQGANGETIANICVCSRKDFRDAVTAARAAQTKWGKATAYNRGQILYRVAEMLEGRRAQFVEELMLEGASRVEADHEIDLAVDRLVYYAGWSDKFQQLFSTVNPVASSHFNFSTVEPTGVVGIVAPENPRLVGLVSMIAPVIVGGNTCVVLASSKGPLSAVTFAEVLNSSDVPAGVVNLLTGSRSELLGHFASHMDVNAVSVAEPTSQEAKLVEEKAVENLKRVVKYSGQDWLAAKAQGPYQIMDFQETKTTWHPVGI